LSALPYETRNIMSANRADGLKPVSYRNGIPRTDCIDAGPKSAAFGILLIRGNQAKHVLLVSRGSYPGT
jgi:hypothetical protein